MSFMLDSANFFQFMSLFRIDHSAVESDVGDGKDERKIFAIC